MAGKRAQLVPKSSTLKPRGWQGTAKENLNDKKGRTTRETLSSLNQGGPTPWFLFCSKSLRIVPWSNVLSKYSKSYGQCQMP